MPVDVLYILGSARSGSTLLGGLLGQAEDVSAPGEFAWLWKLGVGGPLLCGCGVPVLSCPFWSPILTLWPDLQGHAARMTALAGLVHRRRHVPFLLGPWRPRRYQDLLDEYGAHLTALYEAVRARSSARLVVDASKHASYAMALRHVPQIRLHVLHLVRDSRATSYSWTRSKRSPDVPGESFMPRRTARKSAWNWLTDHVASLLVAHRSRRHVRVRYEDLVAAPEEVMRTALERLGIEIDVGAALAHIAEPRTTHTVGGNPTRFSHGWLQIRADEEWYEKARRRDVAVVTAMTWPLLLWFGYPLRARRSPTISPRT